MAIQPDLLILLAGAVVFGFAILVRFPLAPVVGAVPASFLVLHVGGTGGGNSISLADLVLLLAAICAIPLVRWRRATWFLRWLPLVLVYQATTLLSVVHNPNRYDVVEWFHQFLMVAGAAAVGYAIEARGRTTVALQLYVFFASILSTWIILLWLPHGLHPAATLPLGLQKNAIGNLLVVSVLICQFSPPWQRHDGWRAATKYLCIVAVLATGSRQAVFGLVVAVSITFLRDRRRETEGTRRVRSRSFILLFVIGAMAAIAYVSVVHEVNSGAKINSITTREASYTQTLDIWRTSPLFGVGERYWYTGQYPTAIQPPNAEIGLLATGGIVGLLGLLVLLGGSLRFLWRAPPALGGSVALSVMLAHIVEGQFDIFWVTATGSLPWIFLGMALAELHQQHASSELPSTARVIP